ARAVRIRPARPEDAPVVAAQIECAFAMYVPRELSPHQLPQARRPGVTAHDAAGSASPICTAQSAA
ncbi:MAG: hypothetical protein JWP18_2413, partial [Solirubrobacterales bacterium]|nr:hypothetical protein [Solirubrobacterales bacterium]